MVVLFMLTSKDYEKMLHFILGVQEGKSNFQQTVLSLLSEIFGYSHMSFFLANEAGHWCNPVLFNISNDSLDRYAQQYHKIDMFHTLNMPKQLLQKKVVSVTDFMPYDQFENTEFYNGFLKKYDLYYETVMPFNSGNRLLGIIGVFKPKEKGNFTEKEFYVLNNLNKHITFNLQTHLDITQIKYEQYIFKNCTFQSPIGLIVLNHKFSLLHYNELAKNYCTDLTGHQNMTEAIQQIINTMMSKISTQNFGSDIEIDNYSFKMIPLIIPSIFGGIESVYAVYISKPAPLAKPSLDKIVLQFNLTEREKDIIKLIIEGLNNNEIADKLYISIHTVKSHIENIFKKMKVGRRTALLNKINAYNMNK